MKRIVQLFKSFLAFLYYIYCGLISKKNKKDFWLISERGVEAQDNGYVFFRYLRENYPTLDVKYVISIDSPDYEKVSCYGDIIIYGSKEHYIANIQASKLISTHLYGYAADSIAFKAYYLIFGVRGKLISLKHGITKDNIRFLYRDYTNLDLVICGAKLEYDYMLEKFGYSEKQIKYTGFARFDYLCNINVKKQILIMPTWRHFLTKKSLRELSESLYVKRWNSLIDDENFISLIESNGIKVYFYPHFEMQKRINVFNSINSNIIIADRNKYNVQDLLKDSALLITDFSSVFFDFAYMEKPTLFYQFDRSDYQKYHYQKGYFDYDKIGFGEVAFEQEKLLELIDFYIKNDFKIKKKYANRINEFFPKKDNKNCQRIYHEILKL